MQAHAFMSSAALAPSARLINRDDEWSIDYYSDGWFDTRGYGAHVREMLRAALEEKGIDVCLAACPVTYYYGDEQEAIGWSSGGDYPPPDLYHRDEEQWLFLLHDEPGGIRATLCWCGPLEH